MNNYKAKYQDDMEYFSMQLNALSLALETVSIAFQHQKIDDSVIGCLDTLCHSVNDIKSEMDKKILAIIETTPNEVN